MTTAQAAQTGAHDAKHFQLVRLALLRGLKIRKLSEGVWAVTSSRERGREWKVAGGLCECPARAEAMEESFRLYSNAEREDYAALSLRIRQGRLTKSDKTYVRYAVRVAERRMEERGRQSKKAAPKLRRVAERQPSGLTKGAEFCGPFRV